MCWPVSTTVVPLGRLPRSSLLLAGPRIVRMSRTSPRALLLLQICLHLPMMNSSHSSTVDLDLASWLADECRPSEASGCGRLFSVAVDVCLSHSGVCRWSSALDPLYCPVHGAAVSSVETTCHWDSLATTKMMTNDDDDAADVTGRCHDCTVLATGPPTPHGNSPSGHAAAPALNAGA